MLFNHNLPQLLIFVISLDCAYSKGCGWAQVIQMNIDSIIIFRIVLTDYVHAA